jgi:hypothetical protein
MYRYTGVTDKELVDSYVFEANRDADLFWKRYAKILEPVSISNIKIKAFHVLGSMDECGEIRKDFIIFSTY